MAGDTSPEERARIVGLCVRLTGNADVTEDLAQETLFEAWRNEHELRELDKRREWLSGIARNVCRRWIYSQGREIETITTETREWEEDLQDERFDVTEDGARRTARPSVGNDQVPLLWFEFAQRRDTPGPLAA